MKGLGFLKKASLAANEVVKSAVARTTTAKARNPENADIRIYKNGAAYPSVALIGEFELAYVSKDVENKGNGFDVFKSTDYPNTQAWPADEKVVFIAAVPRKEGKTDLFASVGYDAEGNPVTDVAAQGAVTFGKELLEYLEEVYGFTPDEETGYIDLVIMRDVPFKTDNGIYFVPKVVSRGEKKGEMTLLRRDDLTLFPLVPASMISEEETEEVENNDEEELDEELSIQDQVDAGLDEVAR